MRAPWSIHTIKGASSFLGFDLLVKVAHKTEDVLNRLRKGELVVSPEIMDVILEATDLVKILVSDIKAGDIQERETDGTINKLLPFLLDSAGSPQLPAATAKPPLQATAAAEAAPSPPSPTTAESPAPAVAPADSAPETTPVPIPNPAAITAPKKAPAPPKPAEGKGDDLSDNTTVRVDVKRLDDLMNQVGELVLERNRMIQINQDLQQNDSNRADFNEEFGKLTKRMSFVTSELQMQVLKMRMIPVEKVFKKFPRIVRSMSRDLGKEVDLQIVGEETELDRSVVDEIGDPLIHLIRNAMDHGLETRRRAISAGAAS